MHFLLAVGAATTLIFCGAVLTLYEEQVAAIVFAIGMGIAGFAADVAFREDIVGDAFAETVVEDEVLPFKF